MLLRSCIIVLLMVSAYVDAKTIVPAASEGMVLIPAGTYIPLYKTGEDAGRVAVEAFYIDTHPVTNGAYLAFVMANPKWRLSTQGDLI